uniref:methionine adenosyltransferase n=1 Tax=Ndongobacter massiliensis TaxID=1871025 RepID=UPI000931F2E4|nr:methionine adenosyltransferase [Ndongobacter massiliensis]
MRHLFTSESVTEGHPDKLCDQVSDAILDALLEQEREARVACECFTTTGAVFVMGEISAKDAYVDIPSIVRKTVCEIGYDNPASGFDGHTCAVLTAINEQSPDIAQGVNAALEAREGDTDPYDRIGAGDQGMVFGYACDETESFMPLPISLAHALAQRLALVRKEGRVAHLRPDGKTQVTVEYEDQKPVRVDTVLISTQHDPQAKIAELRKALWEEVVCPVIDASLLDEKTKFLVNPTGRFEIGGPQADTGLTGRKIVVDSYGGFGRVGGGAFSGKDPTKVDRSASYYARYIAKNLVAAGAASHVEVGVAYAIGVAKPLSLYVDSFGTGCVSDERLRAIVESCFDLRPAAIIDALQLRRPIYRKTAAYGHFGREDADFTWERIDRVAEIRACLTKA